jgi:hypothetical protein
MKDKLILLERKNPTNYEIHRYEIKQNYNLVLTTKDKEFAKNLVDGYNKLKGEFNFCDKKNNNEVQ